MRLRAGPELAGNPRNGIFPRKIAEWRAGRRKQLVNIGPLVGATKETVSKYWTDLPGTRDEAVLGASNKRVRTRRAIETARPLLQLNRPADGCGQ